MQKVIRKILPVVITMAVILLSQVPVMAAVGSEQASASYVLDGNGSETTPYLITSEAELVKLAEQVNAGTTYKNTYFRLEKDLDLSEYGKTWNGGKGWIGIGTTAATPFEGNFDGNGKVVSNLYSNASKGLFGAVQNGSVKNLGVTNVDISGTGGAGAIVYITANTTISNCYATGKVSGGIMTGGIAGITTNCVITNCYTTCSVNGSYAGGIVGSLMASTISNCYSVGAINGSSAIGGIAGHASAGSAINNCAALNPSVKGAAGVGRVIGMLDAGATLSGNVAFGGMTITGSSFGTANGASHQNGLPKTVEELQAATGFPSSLTASPWTYAEKKLPGFGAPVEMPEHLKMPVVLQSIVVTPPAKTEYFVGEALDLTGLVVTGVYSDESEAPVTGYTTSLANGSSLNTAGTVYITVSYQTFSASFEVVVYNQLSVSLKTSRIVATLGAYLNVTVAGEGFTGNDATVWLKVGEDLLYPMAVTNGVARMYIPAAPRAGAYEIVAKSSDGLMYGSCTLEVVPYDTDIWVMNYTANSDGFVVLVFNEAISARDGLFDTEVSLNGTAVRCEIGTDGRSLVTNVKYSDLTELTNKFTAAGVKFPALFPSYYFTFSVEVPKQ